MKKSIGPVLVIDTKPPYKRWDGNQATYLFFPVFFSFILTLIGTLSVPIIAGLATVEVHSKYGEGVVRLGAWGMCIDGFPHYTSKCVGYSFFVNNTQALSDLPEGIRSMGISPSPIDDAYKIANGIMHVWACFIGWLAVTWTLAASGEYQDKGICAWDWTRWAWWGNTASLFFGIIPFALDVATISKTAAMAKLEDGSAAKVVPGATIYMSTAAVLLNLITLFVRYLWSRRQPRPTWTVKGQVGDYHNNPMPPAFPLDPHQVIGRDDGLPHDLAGLAPTGTDQPPTWESLNLHSALRPTEKEWTRADDALETIEEKRSIIVKDGYAV